jgi:hypothetical protein
LKMPLLNYSLSLEVDSTKIEDVRKAWTGFVQEFNALVTSYREERAGPTEIALKASFQLPGTPVSGASSLVQPFAHVDGLIRIECQQSVPAE